MGCGSLCSLGGCPRRAARLQATIGPEGRPHNLTRLAIPSELGDLSNLNSIVATLP